MEEPLGIEVSFDVLVHIYAHNCSAKLFFFWFLPLQKVLVAFSDTTWGLEDHSTDNRAIIEQIMQSKVLRLH